MTKIKLYRPKNNFKLRQYYIQYDIFIYHSQIMLVHVSFPRVQGLYLKRGIRRLEYVHCNNTCASVTEGMIALESMITTGSVSTLQLLQLPLQFSGGFIELAIVFFVLALVAAAVGASGVAGLSMTIAKWFVILFLVLAVISLIL